MCGRGVQGDADGTGCAQRRRRQPTDEQFASTPREGRQNRWPVPDSRARRLRKVRKAAAPFGPLCRAQKSSERGTQIGQINRFSKIRVAPRSKRFIDRRRFRVSGNPNDRKRNGSKGSRGL